MNNPGIVTIVCEYCGNAVYWDADKVKDAGKQAILPEGFSRLYRGATGRLKSRSFFVTGRVRYSFGHGFWDEWFLEFSDGAIGWLTEDNQQIRQQITITSPVFPLCLDILKLWRKGIRLQVTVASTWARSSYASTTSTPLSVFTLRPMTRAITRR